jgi:hypothetical protein
MRRWGAKAAAAAMLALGLGFGLTGDADAQQNGQPPHAWIFGSWTGGLYPPADTEGPRCTGQPTVIFTRDVVMRSSVLEVTYRQRMIETAAATANGLEFRFVGAQPQMTPLGPRLPSDIGFGCGNPNLLRVERRGPNEIVFPNCDDFPAPLRRCVGN